MAEPVITASSYKVAVLIMSIINYITHQYTNYMNTTQNKSWRGSVISDCSLSCFRLWIWYSRVKHFDWHPYQPGWISDKVWSSIIISFFFWMFWRIMFESSCILATWRKDYGEKIHLNVHYKVPIISFYLLYAVTLILPKWCFHYCWCD